MRQIQPITTWANGQSVQANALNIQINRDNLSTMAEFNYQLLSVTTDVDGNEISTILVAQGNLIMDGAQYQSWGSTGDTNTEAYVWAAQKLNLTLV